MIDAGLANIERNLTNEIQEKIAAIGILCKVFSRAKDVDSIKEKTRRKKEDNAGQNYYGNNKKMQDLIGIRIVTYFYEDVNLLWELFSSVYTVVDESKNKPSDSNFEPQRKNMVCKLPPQQLETFEEVKQVNPIYQICDNTFEIQFRTMLSEGWHEIDHALRYKSKKEWDFLKEESRMFNGIYATLETSDRATKQLFDEMAYKHYKQKRWEAMIRTKFRLHFAHEPLDNQLIEILNNDQSLAKSLYKCERKYFLKTIISSGLRMKVTFDNIVHALNYLKLNNPEIFKLLPENLKIDFESKFKSVLD